MCLCVFPLTPPSRTNTNTDTNSMLMCNLAGVRGGDMVLDPFVGAWCVCVCARASPPFSHSHTLTLPSSSLPP